jgi:hypothetical protein
LFRILKLMGYISKDHKFVSYTDLNDILEKDNVKLKIFNQFMDVDNMFKIVDKIDAKNTKQHTFSTYMMIINDFVSNEDKVKTENMLKNIIKSIRENTTKKHIKINNENNVESLNKNFKEYFEEEKKKVNRDMDRINKSKRSKIDKSTMNNNRLISYEKTKLAYSLYTYCAIRSGDALKLRIKSKKDNKDVKIDEKDVKLEQSEVKIDGVRVKRDENTVNRNIIDVDAKILYSESQKNKYFVAITDIPDYYFDELNKYYVNGDYLFSIIQPFKKSISVSYFGNLFKDIFQIKDVDTYRNIYANSTDDNRKLQHSIGIHKSYYQIPVETNKKNVNKKRDKKDVKKEQNEEKKTENKHKKVKKTTKNVLEFAKTEEVKINPVEKLLNFNKMFGPYIVTNKYKNTIFIDKLPKSITQDFKIYKLRKYVINLMRTEARKDSVELDISNQKTVHTSPHVNEHVIMFNFI